LLATLVLAAAVVVLASCQGPAGEPGQLGPQGRQGLAGYLPVTVPQAATESIIFDVRGVTFLVVANDAAGTKATGDYVCDGEGAQEQIQEAKEVNCGKAKIFLHEV
jgi:hypothetical protein